jgi:hypothetical protein
MVPIDIQDQDRRTQRDQDHAKDTQQEPSLNSQPRFQPATQAANLTPDSGDTLCEFSHSDCTEQYTKAEKARQRVVPAAPMPPAENQQRAERASALSTKSLQMETPR